MVFATEYYGCVYIDTCDAQVTAALLADIRRCLAGSILVLNDKASDFPDVLREPAVRSADAFGGCACTRTARASLPTLVRR